MPEGVNAWLHNYGQGRIYNGLGVSYTYDPAHPHAVASLGGNAYEYDANGNQTKRVIGADTYDLVYDAENRLDEIKKNGTIVASFAYDADGRRVKSTMGDEITLFIVAH